MSDELLEDHQWFPKCNSTIIYDPKNHKDPFNWTLCNNKMYIKIGPSTFNRYISFINSKENKSIVYLIPSSTYPFCFDCPCMNSFALNDTSF